MDAISILSTIVTALATIVIAVATVFYTKFSRRLWEVTKDTADLTKRMYEANNRPYIGIDRVDGKIIEEGNGWASIVFKNFGTLPAKEVWTSMKRYHNKEQFDSLDASSNPMIIHQGGEFFNFILIPNNLFPALQNKQTELNLYVEVHYKGFDNVEYLGKYHYQYAPEIQGFQIRKGEEIRLPAETSQLQLKE